MPGPILSSTAPTRRKDWSVWIVGDSLVHWAADRARENGLSRQLGFQQSNKLRLVWKSGRGDHLQDTCQKLCTRLRSTPAPPDAVIVHVGSNDLGETPLKVLRQQLRDGVNDAFQACPEARIVWSDIIPRRSVRNSCSMKRIEHTRKKFNRFARALCVRQAGGYIRHTINQSSNDLFGRDGVHLSDAGNDILLKDWVAAIENWLAVWR